MPNLPSLRAVALTLLLGATPALAVQESSAFVQDLQDTLITHAASDFAASGSRPGGFRNVDVRYRDNEHGARTYMLCGQAHMGVGAQAEWLDFATLKTAPYEQWLGGAATDMCARAVPLPPDDGDLAAALQAKLGDIPPAGQP